MLTSQLLLLLVVLSGSSLGLVGICCCRCSRKPAWANWGRRLFVGTLAVLGAGSLVFAFQPHNGLVFLGLTFGALVIAMLWEGPRAEPQQRWIPEEV